MQNKNKNKKTEDDQTLNFINVFDKKGLTNQVKKETKNSIMNLLIYIQFVQIEYTRLGVR
jgi:hypothetical protein